jgi:putative transposase
MDKATADLLAPPAGFQDLETLIRGRIREIIEEILEEELAAALGAGTHERSPSRRGYRHGTRPPRTLVTSFGPTPIEVPRGRLQTETGTTEFASTIVRRYERRTRRLDAAMLASYLAGTNTRKIRLALQPLVEGTALSRSAVSRLVGRLQGHFEAWRSRDLGRETYMVLVLDAIHLPVRLAKRVVRVPVQVVLGVRASGEKELLELRLAPSESRLSWAGVIDSLVSRGLQVPRVILLDGNAGLIRSVRDAWPEASLQRCTRHKLENLLAKAPKHCHEELKRDYGAITHAEDGEAATKAYHAFLRKWEKLVPEVAVSLQEAGLELLTFYEFPPEAWKGLRTTNVIERVNEEFRRRVKTQGSFPTEGAALVLLFGLLASGTIRLRKLDGHHELRAMLAGEARKRA